MRVTYPLNKEFGCYGFLQGKSLDKDVGEKLSGYQSLGTMKVILSSCGKWLSDVGRIVVYGHRLIYPTFSSSLLASLSPKDFKMSYTYTVLIILYVVAGIFLGYLPREDLESSDWIIALLVLIVVLAVSVDEIWG